MEREASFTPDAADYVAANRAWLLFHLRGARMRLLGGLFAALLLLGVASGVLEGDWWPLAYVAAGAALWAGLQLLHWLLVPRRVRRMLAQRPSLLTANRFVWDEEGLEATSDAGLARLRWRELHRWFEDGHGFVFLLSDHMLLVLPARALEEAQADDLRATLLAHARQPAKGGA
jgi:YcxB-like protein